MDATQIFVIDGGQTWNASNEAVVTDFLNAAFCQFTGSNIRAFALLQTFNSTTWAETVSRLAATVLARGPFPLAEALQMVYSQFVNAAPLNNPIVYILTSQLPQPVPVGINYGAGPYGDNFTLEHKSIPPYWSNGYFDDFEYPYVWYPSVVCQDYSDAQTCSGQPYYYPDYLSYVYANAKVLSDMGVMMSLTLLPSTISGECPSATFYLGQQDTAVCDDDVDDPAYPLAYTWCALYPVDLESYSYGYTYFPFPIDHSEWEYSITPGSWSDPVNCHCTFIQGPIAFDSQCVDVPSTNALLAAVASASCGAPTKSPTHPTPRPTHVPTEPTTFSPRPPTVAPFCDSLVIPSCGDVVPRDLIFVVDKSDSNNQTALTFASKSGSGDIRKTNGTRSWRTCATVPRSALMAGFRPWPRRSSLRNAR